MVPRLVPEISSLDAFCDGAGAAGAGAGIGDSRSWMYSVWMFLTEIYIAIKTFFTRNMLGLGCNRLSQCTLWLFFVTVSVYVFVSVFVFAHVFLSVYLFVFVFVSVVSQETRQVLSATGWLLVRTVLTLTSAQVVISCCGLQIVINELHSTSFTETDYHLRWLFCVLVNNFQIWGHGQEQASRIVATMQLVIIRWISPLSISEDVQIFARTQGEGGIGRPGGVKGCSANVRKFIRSVRGRLR